MKGFELVWGVRICGMEEKRIGLRTTAGLALDTWASLMGVFFRTEQRPAPGFDTGGFGSFSSLVLRIEEGSHRGDSECFIPSPLAYAPSVLRLLFHLRILPPSGYGPDSLPGQAPICPGTLSRSPPTAFPELPQGGPGSDRVPDPGGLLRLLSGASQVSAGSFSEGRQRQPPPV